MTRRNTLAELAGEDALFADGYDDAIIGVCTVDGTTRILYDREAVLRVLVERDGMDLDGALEFFEFNIEGSYVGKDGPVFASLVGPA